MNKKELNNLIANWGKCKHVKFNNETIKNNVLQNLNNSSYKKRPINFSKMALVFGGAFAVIFLAVQIYDDNRVVYYAPDVYTEQTSVNDAGYDLGLEYGGTTGLGAGYAGSNSVLNSLKSKIKNYISPVPPTDTREFLKTGYDLSVKSREVEKLTKRTQTIIRGYGGRIDSISVNEKRANIKFIIPKSNFDNFQEEVKDDLNPKLISEHTNSQNLLQEKRAIETGNEKTSLEIARLEEQRELLNKSHSKVVNDLNKEIKEYKYNLSVYKNETTTSTARQKIINNNIYYYSNLISKTEELFNQENINYNSVINTIDSMLTTEQVELSELEQSDQDFINVVETVEGHVAIKWVSISEIVEIYVPYYKYILLVLLIIFTSILIFARSSSFKYLD